MKTSVKKNVHTGEQPIRVLKHNLNTRLTVRNKKLIEKLIKDSKLYDKMIYHTEQLAITQKQSPKIDINGCIHLHETYLSYIWIVSFTIFVLYEEGIVIPDQIKRGIKPQKAQNKELIDLTRDLFDYAKSLVVAYSKWDKEYYPNPECFDEDTDEGWYILRNNDLFVEIINFILYHEIAHAEFDHIEYKNNNKDVDVKQLELEADTRAINQILSISRNKKVTELAIVTGIASMLFLSSILEDGEEHPSVDKRIENFIQISKINEDSPAWAFLAIFMKLWDTQFDHNFIYGVEYNNYKELYYFLLKQAKEKTKKQ